MDKKEFDNLRRGDIVRHNALGESYVVDCSCGSFFIAVKTIRVSNPMEWNLITPRTKQIEE